MYEGSLDRAARGDKRNVMRRAMLMTNALIRVTNEMRGEFNDAS
jgi:hypothetical protein